MVDMDNESREERMSSAQSFDHCANRFHCYHSTESEVEKPERDGNFCTKMNHFMMIMRRKIVNLTFQDD